MRILFLFLLSMGYVIKDLRTWRKIMEGPVRGELFKFNLFSNNLIQIRKYQVIQIQQTQRWQPFALKQVLILFSLASTFWTPLSAKRVLSQLRNLRHYLRLNFFQYVRLVRVLKRVDYPNFILFD